MYNTFYEFSCPKTYPFDRTRKNFLQFILKVSCKSGDYRISRIMEQTIFGVSYHKEWKGDRLVNVCRPFDEFRRKREHKGGRKCRKATKSAADANKDDGSKGTQ